MVIASPGAQFSLPEAKRGVYAAAGGLARLVRLAGLQVASEISLTGKPISAHQGKEWLFVNRISKTPESLLDEAVELANEVSQLSPDAIIVTRAGLREAWETGNVGVASQNVKNRYDEKLYRGDNLREGMLFSPSSNYCFIGLLTFVHLIMRRTGCIQREKSAQMGQVKFVGGTDGKKGERERGGAGGYIILSLPIFILVATPWYLDIIYTQRQYLRTQLLGVGHGIDVHIQSRKHKINVVDGCVLLHHRLT